MRISGFVLLLTLFTAKAAGQSDKDAIAILDRFSARMLSSPAVYFKFDIVTSDLKDKSSDTTSGDLLMSRNKYKLDLGNNKIWSDGETSWSYLAAEKEVTINKIDKKDKSFQNNPSEVFTMYRKGYKIRLVEETGTAWIIDLYPEDLDNELQRVRLTLSKPAQNLKIAEYRRKDGVTVTLNISQLDLKRPPDSDGYRFVAAKYPNTEVVDMR